VRLALRVHEALDRWLHRAAVPPERERRIPGQSPLGCGGGALPLTLVQPPCPRWTVLEEPREEGPPRGRRLFLVVAVLLLDKLPHCGDKVGSGPSIELEIV
jgi:hypothetical protein